jgi:hypothetical protein
MARGKKTDTTPTVRAARTRRAADQTTSAPATQAAAITDLEISRLAYQIYESRRGRGGSPLEDWLQAEQQLRSSHSNSSSQSH